MRARLVVIAMLIGSGCGDLFEDIELRVPDVRLDVSEVTVDPTGGKAIGEVCDAGAPVSECRFGLSCIDAVCRTTSDTLENRPCILTDECGDGLYCGFVGACQKAGAGVSGSACTTTGECERGLVCRLSLIHISEPTRPY